MAGTILKNIVEFTGLAIGVPVSLPHELTLNTIPTVPQFVAENAGGFTVTVDAINVTVTRTEAALSGAVAVYVECWHSIEDVLPPDQLVGRVPFYVAAGGGGGSAGVVSYLPGWWSQVGWSAPSDQVMIFANNVANNQLPVGFAGSIVGIVVQLKQAITAGSLTVTVLDDSSPIASLVMTTGSPTFIQFPPGANPFAAGDVISVELDVSADQVPNGVMSVYLLWSPT
jgi:hypothetical protein